MIDYNTCKDAHDAAKMTLEAVKEAEKTIERRTVPIYSDTMPGKIVGYRLVRVGERLVKQLPPPMTSVSGDADMVGDLLCARCSGIKNKGGYTLKKNSHKTSSPYCIDCDREVSHERLTKTTKKETMMNTEVTTKSCKKCGQEKPLDEFYANKQARDKLSYTCKECDKAKMQQITAKKKLEATNAKISRHNTDTPQGECVTGGSSIYIDPYATPGSHARTKLPENLPEPLLERACEYPLLDQVQPQTKRSELDQSMAMMRLFLEVKPMVAEHNHADLLKTIYEHLNKY